MQLPEKSKDNPIIVRNSTTEWIVSRREEQQNKKKGFLKMAWDPGEQTLNPVVPCLASGLSCGLAILTICAFLTFPNTPWSPYYREDFTFLFTHCTLGAAWPSPILPGFTGPLWNPGGSLHSPLTFELWIFAKLVSCGHCQSLLQICMLSGTLG